MTTGKRAIVTVARVGSFVASLALVVLVVAGYVIGLAILGAKKAEATVAFQKDTGRPCASCHATPGTNMRALTSLGSCFRNSGYNISACSRRPPRGRGTAGGSGCRTITTTVQQDGRTFTRRETRCD
jgi:hypothetical protein